MEFTHVNLGIICNVDELRHETLREGPGTEMLSKGSETVCVCALNQSSEICSNIPLLPSRVG